MSDGYFIDGLQTREERQRGQKARGAANWSDTDKKPARVRKYVTVASGDPLVSRGQRQRGAVGTSRATVVARPKAQAQSERSFFEPPKKNAGRNSSEDEYRRKVLGFSDDELEMDLYSDDLYAERKKQAKAKRKTKRKKVSGKKKVAMAVAGLIVVAVAGFYVWGDSLISKITGGNAGLFDLFRSAVLADGSAKFAKDSEGRTNILLFGTSGFDMDGKVGEDDTHDGAQLTDSIMVLSLNQETGDMAMISVQRDLLVGTCTATGKINEVYFCANPYGDDETAGAKALEEQVSNVLGMKIQYYVHINWQALISIVDALDGITVTLDEDVEDDWTNTYIRAGEPTNLNGWQAIALARARHGTIGGDFSRTNSQQKILLGLRERVATRGLGLVELLNVASVLGDNFRTDFSAEEIAAGAKLATTADFGSMRQISLLDTSDGNLLTTGTVGGVSYVLPTAGQYNFGEIRKYVATQLAGGVAVETPAQILVLNGSGVTGIAGRERDELVNAGFTVKDIDDAPAGEYFDAYYLYSLSDRDETREKLETYYNIVARGRDELPDGINTDGVDFVIILGVGYSD